jgi:ABC-type transporter Mla subunit MlaD
VFVLVTAGVLIGALVLTSGILEGRYEIHVRTTEAEGLTQDTRVVLQGLAIGRVKQVSPRLDERTNTLSFVATLSVRERFPDGTRLRLPAGTQALITPPPTLVGPTVLQLLMPEVAPDADFLEPGDTLVAERQGSVVDALTEIAEGVRGQLETLLDGTRSLLTETTETVETTGALLAETRPRLSRVLARVDTSLSRTERILAQVEPRVGPITDSVMTTLASSHALLEELDSLTTVAQAMALENRASIRDAIEKLARSAEILQYFADQISRRPLRFLTGVTPPPDSTVPPDTSEQER